MIDTLFALHSSSVNLLPRSQPPSPIGLSLFNTTSIVHSIRREICFSSDSSFSYLTVEDLNVFEVARHHCETRGEGALFASWVLIEATVPKTEPIEHLLVLTYHSHRERGQRMTFRGVLYASDATDSVRTRMSPRLVVFANSLALLSRFVAHCYR